MKRGYVWTPFGQLHYVTAGSGDNLILLGPAGRSSRVFSGLIPLLAERLHVAAFDTLGFGNSDPLPADVTIELLAESVIGAMDALGLEKAHIYGLHTGNKIATAIGTRWPSRVGDLVLAGQSHSIIPDKQRRNDAILQIVRHYFDDPPESDGKGWARGAWEAALRKVSDLWLREDLLRAGGTSVEIEQVKRLVLDEIQSLDSIAALYRANFAYDLGAEMRRISARTLILEVVTPREDELIGRQGSLVQDIIPGALLATIEEPDGDALTLENRAADLAAILLDFLFSSTRR